MSEKMACTLPNGEVIKTRKTGIFLTAKDVPPGQLFTLGNQIWEALPQSNANLSDFDDGSEVLPNTTVEVLEIL